MNSPGPLPEVPVKHADFVSYVASHPDTPLPELLHPFREYDAKLREIFAQEPDNPLLKDQYLNVVPLFDPAGKNAVRVRARNLESESVEEAERYMMPLDEAARRVDGSPAMTGDIEQFHKNFALFCESSLVDLNWNNVVAAGSSVVTSLLPVPAKYAKSKKSLRNYYHEKIAPASDVDLFLYGLSEEDAVKKIIEIEQSIRDSILTEITTIRTKNAITIASKYPTRHVQIVLRVYKSVSEILTGFDVDCSCVAYDGKQVYAAPRAITAYMSQVNTIDLSRRSPSYESRLSKYSHRGFEVYWPFLNRSRIDPTIFERNFGRTVGLARLLVLERLPTRSERESYMDQRRRERGRPAINRFRGNSANIKDSHDDEIAEWVEQDDVSDYHTFTIPYGPKYYAKKIEKLLYTKDMLLNAEWNKKDSRDVNLHRHPAFFGYAEDVIYDCCGFCPKPLTDEDHVVAEEEAKIYVSGEISFIKDDPGRQAIGSFNPINDDDWTEMAYVGNTARLCQAIIDEDLEHVQDWLAQEGSDPNARDYTGRTPLHLAATSSTVEIAQALIDHGARLVARLADGRTALHLAAARGHVGIVRAILRKSEENEEKEANKADARKAALIAVREGESTSMSAGEKSSSQHSEDSDIEIVEDVDSDTKDGSATTGSYFKVNEPEVEKSNEERVLEADDEPDVYDVNVLAWDTKASPLHFAIVNGHIDVVKELVQNFGADVLLPVKLLDTQDQDPLGAILTLVLALYLPTEKAKAMVKTLLDLGASSAQGDMQQMTALHYMSAGYPELLDVLFENDEPAAKRAINHIARARATWYSVSETPLTNAIRRDSVSAALKLLEAHACPTIDFKAWMKVMELNHKSISQNDWRKNHQLFLSSVEQPIVIAAQCEMPELVLQLLDRNADVNTMTSAAHRSLQSRYSSSNTDMETLLDVIRSKIKELDEYEFDEPPEEKEYRLKDGEDYLEGIEPDSYREFVINYQVEEARKEDEKNKIAYKELKSRWERRGGEETKEAVHSLAERFRSVEKELLKRDAKTFQELYPDKQIMERRHEGCNYTTSREDVSYKVEFDFEVYDLTDETREGYLALFEAAWNNDLSKVKELTLSSWGPEKDRNPLKIAIRDESMQSPFSIAALRGHYNTARAIVEIASLQHEPMNENEKVRYRIADEDDFNSDEEMMEVPVIKEIIDEKFTVENIGEISTKVNSKVLPLELISWYCSAWEYNRICNGNKAYTFGLDNNTLHDSGERISLRTWAIMTGNSELFALTLELDVEYRDIVVDKDTNKAYKPSSIQCFSEQDFLIALQYSRIQLLAEMIKHGGAGMDLEALVKKSGVKLKEKSQFYQGLSVHGKKRADWASAAQGVSTYTSISPFYSPFLRAAFYGNLEALEWFSSTTPSRHYLHFAEAYKHDKHIAHLNTLDGGFEKALFNWLNARRELALHCAVMAKPKPETTKVLKHLLQTMPESLEVKSQQGYTPLALAFSLRRYKAAKLLLAAGADQTARDFEGPNILHLLFTSAFTRDTAKEDDHIERMFTLVDQRLIPSLLRERSSEYPGSLTPLACYIKHGFHEKTLRSILDWAAVNTGNEHLALLDGTGETPVHNAVRRKDQLLLQILLSYRPDLLYYENSVGLTPYEIAKDAYMAECMASVPSRTRRDFKSILTKDVNSRYPSLQCTAADANTESIWRMCEETAEKHPGKRVLVSLLDANEVAKRLARVHRRRAFEDDGDESDGEVEVGNVGIRGQIENWLGIAQMYKEEDESEEELGKKE